MDTRIFADYELTEDEIIQCSEYASHQTNNYDQRNQTNQQKIFEDCVMGKMGELVTYHALTKQFGEVTPVDFEIYEVKDKSWVHDITADDDLTFAVKSCRPLIMGRPNKNDYPSWVFQLLDKNNRGKDIGIFGPKEGRSKFFVGVCMVCMPPDIQRAIGRIKTITTVDFLHDNNLFTEPVHEKFHGLKKVVTWVNLNIYGIHDNQIHPSVVTKIEEIYAQA